MKNNNIIQDKSFAFAIHIVKAYKYLQDNKNEHVISKQILRCGTSIGANIEEAIGGQSTADFISKISIAYKEARETVYWIKLLNATHYLTPTMAQSLLVDCEELCKIIGKIQVSTKSRNS